MTLDTIVGVSILAAAVVGFVWLVVTRRHEE